MFRLYLGGSGRVVTWGEERPRVLENELRESFVPLGSTTVISESIVLWVSTRIVVVFLILLMSVAVNGFAMTGTGVGSGFPEFLAFEENSLSALRRLKMV
jgi:hypothetical protein